MQQKELMEMLEIRYVDLKFTLMMVEDCTWPAFKTSALRGGMGQMLLMQNCIGDRDCDACGFSGECLVRRMMYSKFEIQPAFAVKGDSIGYIIDCRSRKETFQAGEELTFHLLIYGKTIAYFSQFLQAFNMLGQYGVGRHHARFDIKRVENSGGGIVVDGNNVCLQNLRIRKIHEYVEFRMDQLANKGCQNKIVFETPVTIKYQRNFLQTFIAEAIIRSILRRIYSFNCFEGIPIPLLSFDREVPEITEQEVKTIAVPRYSSTAGEKMYLRGISGYAVFDHLPEDLKLIILAGEKTYIGKNTSFGFGKYRLM